MGTPAKSRGWLGASLLLSILALPAGCLVGGYACAEDQSTAADPPERQAPRHHSGRSLDDRVKALTKALDLDAAQQSALRKLLESQREQVMKVWGDPSMPPGYRVIATEAISDNTADQIRALLNDDQKKKYNPPRPPRDPAADSGKTSVEDWMKATKPK